MARLRKGRKQATVQSDVKLNIDATAKARGEPISMLPADWTSVMDQFKASSDCTSQMKTCPHSLTLKVSGKGWLMVDADSRGKCGRRRSTRKTEGPEPPRQYGIHLDSETIQTKRCRISSRSMQSAIFHHIPNVAHGSVETTRTIDLRRLGGRHIRSVSRLILSKKNFKMTEEVGDVEMAIL